MAGERTVLVLGATGGFGGETARQLLAAGWRVRAMSRSAHGLASETGAGESSADVAGIEWVRGDAMNRDDLLSATAGCAVVVHAVNPPGYRRWHELVLPMLDNTIAAAKAEGATVVLPGNVYNFGPDAFPLASESSPQNPRTRKGAIRVKMERRLHEATRDGHRVLIVRAGDFFGPRATNNWFAQVMVKPGKTPNSIVDPGTHGAGHQWAYLPDAARVVVELLERRDRLDPFASFHLGGHWDADGSAMVEAIRRVVARRTGTEPRVRRFPWRLLALASPFVAFCAELNEMRYLWRDELRLDNSRLLATLGREPHMPLDEAVETMLEALGCFAGRP